MLFMRKTHSLKRSLKKFISFFARHVENENDFFLERNVRENALAVVVVMRKKGFFIKRGTDNRWDLPLAIESCNTTRHGAMMYVLDAKGLVDEFMGMGVLKMDARVRGYRLLENGEMKKELGTDDVTIKVDDKQTRRFYSKSVLFLARYYLADSSLPVFSYSNLYLAQVREIFCKYFEIADSHQVVAVQI